MPHASAPCADETSTPLFPTLRALWSSIHAVSAVHVRIAFDSPWADRRKHGHKRG
jgi:hypothetical protein